MRTDVKIRALGGFLSISVNADGIVVDRSKPTLLTGGLLSSSLAIPFLSSTDTLTSFWRAADDEKLCVESARSFAC